MECPNQSSCLWLMMWIVEKTVFVSVYITEKVMDAAVATGRCEYKLS